MDCFINFPTSKVWASQNLEVPIFGSSKCWMAQTLVEKFFIKTNVCHIPVNIIHLVGSLRGLSQYALLHFGQTLGYSFLLRGTQVCPHRSHWYPCSVIFAISLDYITTSI